MRGPLPRPRPLLPPTPLGYLIVACLSSTASWKTGSQKTQPVCCVSPAGSGLRVLLKSTATKEASQVSQLSWATWRRQSRSLGKADGWDGKFNIHFFTAFLTYGFFLLELCVHVQRNAPLHCIYYMPSSILVLMWDLGPELRCHTPRIVQSQKS